MKSKILTLKNCHLTSAMETTSDALNRFMLLCVLNDQSYDVFNLNRESFLREFRTFVFGLPRRTGKTTSIIKTSMRFSKSSIFAHNSTQMKYFTSLYRTILNTDYNSLKNYIKISSQFSELCTDIIIHHKPKAIFADEWSLYPKKNQDKIIRAINSTYTNLSFEEQPFIFLIG